MWRILFLVPIFYIVALSNGQVQSKRQPPMITKFLAHDLINSEQVKFIKENALILPCGATGNNLKWIWFHNDTQIPNGELKFGKRRLSADGTLTGSFLDSSHSGTYQCFVRDTVSGVETFSRKIKVAVTVVGDFTDKADVEKVVDLGSPFSYACPAHQPSYGAIIAWEGNNNIQFKRSDTRAIVPFTGDLFIVYVTEKDIDDINGLGGIRCTMYAANTFYSSGALTVRKRTPDQTDPQTLSAPTWKVLPGSSEIAIEGRNKTLYCLAIGRPAPKITWKKDSVPVEHGKGSFEIPNEFQERLLNIINVKRDAHQGEYTCEAENSQNTGSPITHDIDLRVEVSPKWTTGSPPENKTTFGVSGSGTLTCDVTAIPAPSFRWYKDGREIDSSTDRVRLDNNKLHFQNIALDDGGIYQCVATNKHGMIVSQTWVNIVEPGVFQFQAQEMRVEESVGVVAILIENTGNKNVTAQFRITTSDMQATDGEDYVKPPEIVSFASGDAVKELQIPIIEDVTSENEETFQVSMTLTGPARPSVTIGPQSVLTVTIEDNDPPLAPVAITKTTAAPTTGTSTTEPPPLIASASNGDGGNITLDYEANITVVCMADYIEVTLKKDNFPGLIVNDSLLHLEDMACGAGYKDDTMVKFTFGLESCGTMQDKGDDKLIYKNKVYLTADPGTDDDAITRKHSEVIPFQCSYDRKATISKVSYSPRSTLVITDAEGFGNFTYEMDMYKDADNSEEVTEFPYEVGLGLPMYFGFRVLSADSKLDVFPDVCKATAGSDFDSTPDHLIIENACSRDNTLKYTYEQKSEHFFSVAAFRFKEGYNDVFIHCKLTVCREDDSGSRCARGCESSRRRRSINEEDLSVKLTIGPMKLTNKKKAFGEDAVDKESGAAAASSNGGMVIIVAALVGVLGTVAIGLVVALVIIGRRRRYSAVNKGTALIVAEEM